MNGQSRQTGRVYLSLGSNMGDKRRHLKVALNRLVAEKCGTVHAVSAIYETEPWGGIDQPNYLNLVAEIETALEPLELLNAIKNIECAMGRVPRTKWGPREIDIDIVLWGNRMLETERLTIPHPEFRNRAFVLEPMAEIAGDAVDPVTGATVAELAKRPEAVGRVTRTLDH